MVCRLIVSRTPQMIRQNHDVRGRFFYKNQCNTIGTTGKFRVTRPANSESLYCGPISTVA